MSDYALQIVKIREKAVMISFNNSMEELKAKLKREKEEKKYAIQHGWIIPNEKDTEL